MCGRAESGDFVVQDWCRRAIASLYIALSLVMPAVPSIDVDILRTLDLLLLKMPWGDGKGYTLASAHHVGQIHGLSTAEDGTRLLAHCTQLADSDGGAERNDVLLVLAALSPPSNGADGTSVAARCRRILSGDTPSPAVHATRVTATVKSLSFLPELFGGDGDGLGGARLLPGVGRKEVAATVKALTAVADDDREDARVRDAAVVGVGMLASMRSGVGTVARRGGGTMRPPPVGNGGERWGGWRNRRYRPRATGRSPR